ncbi:hypothetical protein H632_c4160p0, partial [Helicosporidium sp. ATCC 50920]
HCPGAARGALPGGRALVRRLRGRGNRHGARVVGPAGGVGARHGHASPRPDPDKGPRRHGGHRGGSDGAHGDDPGRFGPRRPGPGRLHRTPPRELGVEGHDQAPEAGILRADLARDARRGADGGAGARPGRLRGACHQARHVDQRPAAPHLQPRAPGGSHRLLPRVRGGRLLLRGRPPRLRAAARRGVVRPDRRPRGGGHSRRPLQHPAPGRGGHEPDRDRAQDEARALWLDRAGAPRVAPARPASRRAPRHRRLPRQDGRHRPRAPRAPAGRAAGHGLRVPERRHGGGGAAERDRRPQRHRRAPAQHPAGRRR